MHLCLLIFLFSFISNIQSNKECPSQVKDTLIHFFQTFRAFQSSNFQTKTRSTLLRKLSLSQFTKTSGKGLEKNKETEAHLNSQGDSAQTQKYLSANNTTKFVEVREYQIILSVKKKFKGAFNYLHVI